MSAATSPVGVQGVLATELKSCPFCGAAPLPVFHVLHTIPKVFRALCSDGRCGAFVDGRTAIGVALVWNRRTPAKQAGEALIANLILAAERALRFADLHQYMDREGDMRALRAALAAVKGTRHE